jgi:lysophospholipid acyltransferase
VQTSKATLQKRIPHGRKRVASVQLAIGLIFLVVYAVYGGKGSYSRILTDRWYEWGFVTKFAFIQFAGFMTRTKYYAAWSLTEVSQNEPLSEVS